MAIPIQQELSSVYTSNSVPTQEQRYASLTDAFEVIYSAKPSYIARAPGRVNAYAPNHCHLCMTCAQSYGQARRAYRLFWF